MSEYPEQPDTIYIEDTRTDRCRWCKDNSGTVAGYDSNTGQPVCGDCVSGMKKWLPEKFWRYYLKVPHKRNSGL